MKASLACAAVLIALSAGVARAEEPSWLRSKNSAIEDGNEKLNAGDAAGALQEYDRAARTLPSEGGVHLNRGLALLKQGKLDLARDALKMATDSAGTSEVRSDAYYDLGVAFYRQAEAAVADKNDDAAQKAFREASDAFRKSIRQKPGNANAAYNYEVTQQRIVELKKKQEEQQKKDEEKKDEQNQDQQNQDQQGQDQQNQDQQNQDQQNQDQQGQDQQKQDQPKQDGDKQDQAKKPEPQKPDPKQQQQQQQQPQQAQQGEEKQPKPGEKPLPADVQQALDALQNGEKNLEQQRAMQRSGGHRRAPEKDW